MACDGAVDFESAHSLACNLFAIQLGVDFISSYRLGAWVTQHFSDSPAIKYLFDMRLNYWVIHLCMDIPLWCCCS